MAAWSSAGWAGFWAERRRLLSFVFVLRLLTLMLSLTLLSMSNAEAAAKPVVSKKPGKLARAVELTTLNTHEIFVLRPTLAGRFVGQALRGWNRFLRCHHTQKVHNVSPLLATFLYRVATHFDGHRVLIVAGYRAPRIAREKGNPKSPHPKGLACDFRVEGVATTTLRDFVRSTFHRVGVGYYPNSDFVHLDVGRKTDAFWIDYSGPGERADYSPDPGSDLQAEKLPLKLPAGQRAPAEAPEVGGPEPPDTASSPGSQTPKPTPEADVTN